MLNEGEPSIEVMAPSALRRSGPAPPEGRFPATVMVDGVAANGSRETRSCTWRLDWLTSECKTSPGNEETARVR